MRIFSYFDENQVLQPEQLGPEFKIIFLAYTTRLSGQCPVKMIKTNKLWYSNLCKLLNDENFDSQKMTNSKWHVFRFEQRTGEGDQDHRRTLDMTYIWMIYLISPMPQYNLLDDYKFQDMAISGLPCIKVFSFYSNRVFMAKHRLKHGTYSRLACIRTLYCTFVLG